MPKTLLILTFITVLLSSVNPTFSAKTVDEYVGEFQPLEIIPGLGWQYKGGAGKVMLFNNPNDVTGSGGEVVLQSTAAGLCRFEYNGVTYEFRRTKEQTLTVYIIGRK